MQALIVLVAVLVGLVFAGTAPAGGTIQYPGCGATLADCINAAPAGATIVLRTNGVARIPDIDITKGLTFVAAPGFNPGIGSTSDQSEFNIGPAEVPATVSFQGLRILQIEFDIFFETGSGHRAEFVDNVVKNDSIFGTGIQVYYSDTSQGEMIVRDNRVAVPVIGIETRVQGGPATITGNRVIWTGPQRATAGIALYGGGDSGMNATIASNTVQNATDGIIVDTDGTAIVDAYLANNTIDKIGSDATPGHGIELHSGSGTQINGFVYNNSVSNAKGGIQFLQGDGALSITGDRNNLYRISDGNELNGFDIGTILHRNPRFVARGAGDLRLRASSGLVNAGETCTPGGPLTRSDTAGRFRVAKGLVDIGGYEQGSTVEGFVPGINFNGSEFGELIEGTNGRDVLCGFDGNDELIGRRGADVVLGGAGADELKVRDGIEGNDFAFGGPGADTCRADRGDRRISC